MTAFILEVKMKVGDGSNLEQWRYGGAPKGNFEGVQYAVLGLVMKGWPCAASFLEVLFKARRGR